MFKNLRFLTFILIILTNNIPAQPFMSFSSLPVHHAPNKEFHMIHLGLDLHFNIPEKEVMGKATEKIVPLIPGFKVMHLNAKSMTIKDVTVGKKNLSFKYDGKILSVNLDKSYGLDDTLTFSVEYNAFPPSRGILFVLPDSSYPDVTPQLWSQSESEDAQFWYPCHDYPDDFSTSSISITVPSGWVAVSNGILKKTETEKKNNTKTFFWVENKPHVVYLNSVVAGKFKILQAKWDHVPIYYYVPSRYVKDAKNNFSHTPDILKYFSKITGYHYPWQKLSLSGVAQFTAGGMENVSAITLTNDTFHNKFSLQRVSETTTDLVSHEIAHQWFGDLLTCRNWTNIWLNEGFATYFEALYGEHAFGKNHFMYEIYKDHLIVLNSDKYGKLPTVDNRYGTADDAFGSNVYERGASILHMLKYILGDKLFFRTIKYYVRKNQFQNVGTHDLEKAVRNVTGRNLYWFYNEWIYKGGHPVFNVSYNYNDGSGKLFLKVKQTQKVDSLTPVYKMPVDVYIVTPSEKILKKIWIDSLLNNYEFNIPEKPLMVNFDEGNVLIKKLNFNKSVEELAYQLKNDKNLSGRIWAAGQLGAKKDNQSEAALIESLRHDAFFGVRAACAKSLDSFNDKNVKSALFAAEKDDSPFVRAAAAKSLSKFKGDDVFRSLSDLFNRDKIYAVRAAAVSSLAAVDSVKALPIIKKALNTDSYKDRIRIAALEALSRIDVKKAYARAKKFAEYGQPEDIRPVAISLLARLNPDKSETDSLLKNYSQDPFWSVRRAAVNALGKVGDKTVLPFLLKMKKKIDDYRIMEDVRFAIEEIKYRNSHP